MGNNDVTAASSAEGEEYELSPGRLSFDAQLRWYVAELCMVIRHFRREKYWLVFGALLLAGAFAWPLCKILLLLYAVVYTARHVPFMMWVNSEMSRYGMWGLPLAERVRVGKLGRMYMDHSGFRFFLPWQDRDNKELLCREWRYMGHGDVPPVVESAVLPPCPTASGQIYRAAAKTRLFAQPISTALWLLQVLGLTVLYLLIATGMFACGMESGVGLTYLIPYGSMILLYILVAALTYSWCFLNMPYERSYRFYKRAVVIRFPWRGVWMVPYCSIRGLKTSFNQVALDLGRGVVFPCGRVDLPEPLKQLRRRFSLRIFLDIAVNIVWGCIAFMQLWVMVAVKILLLVD